MTLIGPENDNTQLKGWAIELFLELSRIEDNRGRIATTSGAITQLVTLIGPGNSDRLLKGSAIELLGGLSRDKGISAQIATTVKAIDYLR